MMRIIMSIAALLFSLSIGLANENDTMSAALRILAPGAQWVLSGGICTDSDAAQGLTWLDKTISRPTCAQINAVVATLPPPSAPGVPTQITSMQAKVALLNAGLLANVQTWINAQDATTQLIWNTASSFNRNSALVGSAATALGMTSAQVDQLFVAAAAINP